MKIFERFQKKLTIDYINKFLHKKGIVTNDKDEHTIWFKLNDRNWSILHDKNLFMIRISFGIAEDIDLDCLTQASNAVNSEKWIAKSFITGIVPNDDNSQNRTVWFTYETLCMKESDFAECYEYGMYSIYDAMEYHGQVYHQLLDNKQKAAKNQKIGFQTGATEPTEIIPTAQSKPRRIGFSM